MLPNSVLRRGAVVRRDAFVESKRTFFASKWVKRLDKLLEPNRRPPAPVIPKEEVCEMLDPRIRPVIPMNSSTRTGVLAYKIGMMSLWDQWGERRTITVAKVDRCRVIEARTAMDQGFEAMLMGLGYRNLHRHSKPNIGRYIKLGCEPKHVERAFKVTPDCMLPEGHIMSVRHYVPGMKVFSCGTSKAKGFCGVKQRWGHAGLGDGNNAPKGKRKNGASTGQRGSAIVWRGKEMAGHWGPDPRVCNNRIFRIESTRNLIFLQGCIPGHKGAFFKIFDGRGRTKVGNNRRRFFLPHPTFIPNAGRKYPTVLQRAPRRRDPFLYPEVPFYDEEARSKKKHTK
eukprot:Platyproteum_vivax@DN12428_c0_g1_i1.p1